MSQVDKKNKLIPNDWASTKLDCVVNIVRGVTYKKDQASDFFVAGYLPVIRANNIQNDKLILSDFVYVDANIIKCTQKIKKNDIIVAMSSGSKSVVGKTAKAESDLDAAFGAFCGLLRPSSLIIPEMIGFYTRSAYYRNKVSELSAGANINNLKPAHFCELDFPLPPLAEQKEIAGQLDTLLAQVEATQAHLARIPDIIKLFRQSVLSAAVSGKLTEEWRELNKGVERWRLVELKEAAEIIDPHPSHRTPKAVDGGVPYIGIGDLKLDGSIDFENSRKVSFDVLKEHNERYTLKAGDFIFGKIGTLGKATILPIGIDYTLSANVILIQPIEHVATPEYLQFFLSSPSTLNEIAKQANSTSQAAFGIKKMRTFQCKLPNKEEQNEIVRRVEQLFAYADSIEQQAKAAKARVDKLTQAILAKAFRGELTADWRAANPDLISGDNSAAALLARIQAERATVKPRKSRRV
jgi:type I restriction enzyme S subunit